MKPSQVKARGLVHDIIRANDEFDAVETGCGIVLATARNELVWDQPTSCLFCISGELKLERDLIEAYVAKQKLGGERVGLDVNDYLNYLDFAKGKGPR